MSMPIKTLRDGAIKTAVFEQQTTDGRTSYSVVLERSFKKKDSTEWESQKLNIFAEDLLKIASLCERTYWGICEVRECVGKPVVAQEQPVSKPKLDASDDSMPF